MFGYILASFIGLVVGGCLGVTVMAMCFVAGKSDEQLESRKFNGKIV